jgi:hypothetical protein
LSRHEFLDLTPLELNALTAAWERQEKRTDQRFGLIACVLANINRSSDDEPYDVRDFMPMTPQERQKFEAAKIRASQQRFAAAVGLQPKES